MKTCPTCGASMDDATMFCTQCGTSMQSASAPEGPAFGQDQQSADQAQSAQGAQGFSSQNYSQPNYSQQNYGPQGSGPMPGAYPPPAPVYDPYDHTAEFSPKDISDNKVIAILVYLMGTIGIIIALLASKESPYVAFHLRQGLKFLVVETLCVIVMAILAFTIIVPIAGGIFLVVLWVIKIICFFQICTGKAKEPVIIRSLGFLK